MLKYKDVLKLEGLGWIEYQHSYYPLSIEVNSIDMVYFSLYLLFKLISFQNQINVIFVIL
jgi:hypothetical protein